MNFFHLSLSYLLIPRSIFAMIETDIESISQEANMDNETQYIYTTTMSIADKIDKALMKKNSSHESVKELLRMDLRDFLIFLTIADHVIAKDEIRYINKSLGYDFDDETMKQFALNSKISREDFLNQPPA